MTDITPPASSPLPSDAAAPQARKSGKAAWDDTIKTILYAILIAMVFRSFAFEPFHIPSGSMKSNLLVGDYLFVSKYSYGYSRYSFPLGLPIFEGRIPSSNTPERGDVVVFRLPRNPRVDFIKRVIGLPGDTVEMRAGVLYLNGKPLKVEPVDVFVDDEDPNHARSLPRFHETLPSGKVITVLKEKSTGFENNTGVYRVPEGHYFMMGDNRDHSHDSRFEEDVGFVPAENIVGRAELILFSTDGSASWWEVWKWPLSLRSERFFKRIE